MSVSKYLMHTDDIVLLDEILYFDMQKITCATTIKDSMPFLNDGVFPTFKSIEIMAQTLGVYQGKMAELVGQRPRMGFLLGARKFYINKSNFKIGDKLIVHARQSLQDESGFGVYDCEIFCGDELAAKASINVFSPSEEELKRIVSE